MLEKYASTVNEGNLERWLSLWNNRGVQMPPNDDARVGIVQIRDGMEPLFQADLDITITGVQDVIAYHDTGLTRCTYTLTMTPPGRAPVPLEPDGKALTIYARQFDGSWDIIYDCFNTSVPLP